MCRLCVILKILIILKLIKVDGYISGPRSSITENPIFNPVIPYVELLPKTFFLGQIIRIQGLTDKNTELLTIDLSCDTNTNQNGIGNNTDLHMSVRFKNGHIVRNWLKDGIWAEEERAGGLPFKAGSRFEIIILLDVEGDKIALNGQHFCKFPYHFPKINVTHLVINAVGKLQISLISFENQIWENCCALTTTNLVTPIFNPQTPYAESFPADISRGQIIRVQGTTNPTANGFSINLSVGSNTKDSPSRHDTDLHIDVRFKKSAIVINSLQKKTWGTEKLYGLPIEAGDQFEILILCDIDDYKVAINGEHFCTFPSRISRDNLKYLVIDGDIYISLITSESQLDSSRTGQHFRNSESSCAVEGSHTASLPQGYGHPCLDGLGWYSTSFSKELL